MHRLAWKALLCAGACFPFAACGGGSNGGAPSVDGGEGEDVVVVPDGGGPQDGGGSLDGPSPHDGAPVDGSKPHDAAPDVFEAGPFTPAPHPPWMQVPPNQGVVLKSMKLVTVVSTGDKQASSFFGFGDALIGSAWWKSFSTEYALGTPTTNVHVTGPAITTNPTGATMEQYIASAIAGTPAAAADGNTMYMLYLPPGIDIVDDTSGQPNTNCQFYGGYHTTYGTNGDAWGVGQHCPVTGTGLTDLQWMTIVGSHEIAEAASDPTPGTGWTPALPDTTQPWTQSPWQTALFGEIGDMCVSTQITEAGYTYQRIWSNAAAAKGGDPCVPAFSQYPYYNASAPKDWYTIAAGGTVTVTLTGFSDRAAPDWAVLAQMWNSGGGGSTTPPTFVANVTSPTVYHTDIGDYPTTNNGKTSTLTVTAPAVAPSGTWATIAIYSYPLFPAGEDPYHLWFVGVYVP
jgi:hypothetical protein